MFRATKLKYLYLLMSLLLVVVALTACGETQSTPAPAEEPAAEEPAAEAEEPAAEAEEPAAEAEEPAAEAEEPAAEAEEPAAEAEEPAAEAEEPAAEAEEPAAEAMAEGGLPEVDPLSVTGDIISAGSSTVFPLSERMADRFTDEGYAGTITVDSIGTGGGFERFCVAAETDIANASRPINEEETAACQAAGREPIEFRVGTDALAVVLSSENDFAEDVTLEELAHIYSDAETWADVRPEWPAEPIQRFSPGTDSGTFDYFVEAVMDEVYVTSDADEGKGEEAILNAANLQLSEDDNVLVQGVEGSPYAIGYFGYAYFQENQGNLKALSIGGMEPTAETAENGDYPLSRPLFIYSSANILTEKPQVADFVNYYLTHVNEEITDVGYFPASEEALAEAKNHWLAGMGMGEMAAGETEAPAAEAGAEGGLPEVDPLSVTGDIISAGSSTVFPLSERMADRFTDEGYAGTITVDSIGTGGGFERFCVAAETDIANASRPINEEETAACQAAGREPIEFRVGTDALAVVLSSENDFAEDVTLEELAHIYSDAETWADVRPEWPAEPIQRFSPGTDSGTFDYFVESVLDEVYVTSDADEGKGEEAILNAANLQLSEDDNVLVQGVEGSPYAIGYFGYAYFQENQGNLKALSIDGVTPDAETAENGDYPLSRPLFIYSSANILTEKPQVADFVNYYLTHVNEEITDVGYFPASEEALAEAKNHWLAGMGMGEISATEGAAEEGGAGEVMAAAEMPEVDPLSVTGDIISAGSSTVFPLSERMADRFTDEGYAGTITVDSIGTGGGFERFCVAAETDIANASRPINEEETAACQAAGREPIEFRVGTDALAVVLSSENDFAEDVTLEELALIYSDAETWADVRPEWPAEPIQRFSPGTDSGTFDYFVEAVMDEVYVTSDADEGKGEEAILNAANLQLSEDDNVLVQGVEGSPYAIGYFGYAYFQENQGNLKALSIGGIMPDAETAENGDYPLARPLFIYSSANIMTEKPQVAAFVNYYLTHVNEEIIDVGYFPASNSALDASMNNWLVALGLKEGS